MDFEPLTLDRIEARPVVLPLARPIVARIATIEDWPLILIDLHTREGVVGRSLRHHLFGRSVPVPGPGLHHPWRGYA